MRLTITGTDVLRGAEQRVRVASRAWMQGVLRLYRDTVKELSPVASGSFRRSIFYRTRIAGTEVSGFVGSHLPDVQAAAVEFGRRPGKMPPEAPILAWMAIRGIDRSAAFPIRRKIAEEGTKGAFPFRRAAERNKGLLRSQARRLETRLAREVLR